MQGVKKSKTARREILLFLFCLSVMSILYGTPRLFSQGFTLSYLKELGVDCLIMAIACLPVWWLHFRKWTHLPMKRRFALHLGTAVVYYAIWVGLYQLYHLSTGLSLMEGRQVFQNMGPNILFYVQVFSSLHIDLFFREREAQKLREQELKELAHKAEINALKAQIQPHFLFNTLNSISASVPAEQEHTRVLIARLADTFRYALGSTREELVPLSRELDFMSTYLSLEKARFGKRLDYRIEKFPGTEQVLIPPMLLQPLVENAVKHGIEPSIDGGSVVIKCISLGDKTRIAVENTGQPYIGKAESMLRGEGVGLSNTARRLENQFGEKLRISVSDSGAVAVCFRIPS